MAVHSISNHFLRVNVNSFGAELCSVYSPETAIEYIWQADPSVWARHAPNLFPLVGKLKEGSYVHEGATYKLPQHGFARDQDFVCIEESEHKLCFELTATEQTLKDFPFHFSLQISYTLTEHKIRVDYSVFNPDSKELYFSIGAHPAFNCPLQANEAFEEYELQFKGLNTLTLHKLQDGLISTETETVSLKNKTLALSPALFDKDAMVFKNTQIEYIKLVSKKSGHGVALESINWPYYGIWTKSGTSKFLCLEPWYGIADSIHAQGTLSEKEGIIKLKPEDYFICSFELDFF